MTTTRAVATRDPVAWVEERVTGSSLWIENPHALAETGPFDTVVSIGRLERAADLDRAVEAVVGVLGERGRFVFVERTSATHDVLAALWDGGLAVVEADHDPVPRRARDLGHVVRGVATRRHMPRPPRPELARDHR